VNSASSRGEDSLARTVVLGVGNLLLRDEGVGVHVAHALERVTLPQDVEVIDGGCSPHLPIPDGVGKLIVVDAVRGGGEAGAIYRFRPQDVTTAPGVMTSVHQIGLLEVLSMAGYAGAGPWDIVIIGVEPKEIDWGLELTPELEKKIPQLVELVLREIGEKGERC
jgi:hydrogenase maturation protease